MRDRRSISDLRCKAVTRDMPPRSRLGWVIDVAVLVILAIWFWQFIVLIRRL